jgi:hypothetical protein
VRCAQIYPEIDDRLNGLADWIKRLNHEKEILMKMLEAMRKCEPGGYIARKAYPNRKYEKDKNGIFPEAATVHYIDFLAKDWEHYPPDKQGLPLYQFTRHGDDRSQHRLCFGGKK